MVRSWERIVARSKGSPCGILMPESDVQRCDLVTIIAVAVTVFAATGKHHTVVIV